MKSHILVDNLRSAWQGGKSFLARNNNGQRLKTILTIAFFIAVAYLLYSKGSEIEWSRVFDTFLSTEPSKLLIGFGLALACYSAYSCYDLFGRYLLKLPVNPFKACFIAWISYAFNLNLGAIVGGVAFRYRLYGKLGISAGDVTRLLGISVASNWIGYILLAGVLLMMGGLTIPESWALGTMGLRVVGTVGIAIVITYFILCARSARREFSVGSTTITLPSLTIAFMQLGLACIHWTLMAAVIYQFMPDDIPFSTVYAVLLLSGLAGALAHVPGGLGVLEAVFITFLSGQAERYEILAALFAYRSVFYLAPLAMALPSYGLFELLTTKRETARA